MLARAHVVNGKTVRRKDYIADTLSVKSYSNKVTTILSYRDNKSALGGIYLSSVNHVSAIEWHSLTYHRIKSDTTFCGENGLFYSAKLNVEITKNIHRLNAVFLTNIHFNNKLILTNLDCGKLYLCYVLIDVVAALCHIDRLSIEPNRVRALKCKLTLKLTKTIKCRFYPNVALYVIAYSPRLIGKLTHYGRKCIVLSCRCIYAKYLLNTKIAISVKGIFRHINEKHVGLFANEFR